ncbi:hypothetical protein AK830_g2506 [Neonectria ditissima]|uniref:Uncharacterized protein n=1 Tax=Neonectria ditissima TaxID=78410 RepID=A0A0P7BV45_9HYPO|nr:hypothetical protein AK830_g2506 [Neonectria ditissima]
MDETIISAEEQRKLLRLLSALLSGANPTVAFNEADSQDSGAEKPPSGGGYFAPGTKILTRSGEINIEDIQADSQIVTRAGESPEYGVCSGKTAVVDEASSDILLYGLNYEQPFFSASSVFHTTTGRRALDPESALRENLSAEDNIGRLSVGRVLLHTADGKSYNPVPIQQLQSAQANSTLISGIHLKEGARSYHANGFLMYVNYPEITNENVAKMIGTLPEKQRLEVLSRFPKLRPLLEELDDKKPRAFEPDFESRHGRPMAQQYLNHSWNISCRDDGGPLDHSGYTLEVREGEVFIDDELCDSARVDKSSISWQRYLEGEGWEHGLLKINYERMDGEGMIYHGSEDQSTPGSQAHRIHATPLG